MSVFLSKDSPTAIRHSSVAFSSSDTPSDPDIGDFLGCVARLRFLDSLVYEIRLILILANFLVIRDTNESSYPPSN